MAPEFSVSDDVKELISEIIAQNNWDPVIEVNYSPGTEAGDGYASKHVSVEVISEKGSFKLFVKYALNLKIPNGVDMSIEKIYANETYFYNVIYPAYSKFLTEKNIETGFRNVSKCYGASTKNVIALENLKERGFALFDRSHVMNDKHISLVLRTFAKFHAISYAFKDQDREGYNKLESNANQDFMMMDAPSKDAPHIRMWWNMIADGVSKLDPVADKHIIEKCNVDELFDFIVDGKKYANEYSIITQGDCWCNNMMFLYEKDNRDTPTDVVLVDWQMVRTASPVFDISYFFYTIADEKALSKLDSYLKEYYAELCDQIKQLGSDPEQLYPFSVFDNEWKLYCRYGFAMAFTLFKVMLLKKEEVPNFEDIDYEKMKNTEKIDYFPKFNNDLEYTRRIRILGNFMVNKGYL